MSHFLQTLRLYFKDRVILAAHCLALVSIQLGVWFLWFKLTELPDEVPLWHTRAPIDQLAAAELLWLAPGVAVAAWLINLALGLWLYRRYMVLGQMLAVLA